MAEAQLKQLQQQQENNGDIDEKEQKQNGNKAKLSKVISAHNLEFSNDENSILNEVKGKLKKSSHKMNKSEFPQKVGKVIEDEDNNNEDKDDNKDKKNEDALDINFASLRAESADEQ